MFQRIQSLFLIVAAGFIGALFFTPMIRFSDGVTVLKYIEYYPTLILLIVSFVLSVTLIFSYKKRMFQVRVCTLNMLILTGLQIFLLVKFLQREPEMVYSFTAVFPIVAAILTFLAMKYIARDHAMVVSSSRLRPSKRRR